jgi:Uma2 family endonuclease
MSTARGSAMGDQWSSVDTAAVPSGLAGTVPSLDEIYRLTHVPEVRTLFPKVSFEFYEQLVDSIPASSNIHVDYDGRDLEITGKSRRHERLGILIAKFIELVAEELGIPYCTLGQTTWKRRRIARGLESDDCFYFDPEKIRADAAGILTGADDIASYPNPDLAVEVDLSPPRVDRSGTYAALRVAEVWRFDGHLLIIERLDANGVYLPVERSGFVPVGPEEVMRWVLDAGSSNQADWSRRLRAWVRGELTGRVNSL